MGKVILDADIDAMLQLQEGDEVHVCTAEPTTVLEARTTFNLATQAIDGADFTLANGDTSGRKNTLTPDAAASITATGTGNHICVTRAAGTSLANITTATAQLLTSGGTVDIGAMIHEIGDPT